MSMVKYFFDINNSALARSLFATTMIGKDAAFMAYCGQFPVIHLNFGPCRGSDWRTMFRCLRNVICLAYDSHKYLLHDGTLDRVEHQRFEDIRLGADAADYLSAVARLTELLERRHKKRVIVLIDEYDKPVNEAYECGYDKEALPFLISAFTGALKDTK